MFSVDSDQDYRQMNEHPSIEHQVQRTCAECREPFWMAVSGEYQAIVLCDRCLSRAEQAAQVRRDILIHNRLNVDRVIEEWLMTLLSRSLHVMLIRLIQLGEADAAYALTRDLVRSVRVL